MVSSEAQCILAHRNVSHLHHFQHNTCTKPEFQRVTQNAELHVSVVCQPHGGHQIVWIHTLQTFRFLITASLWGSYLFTVSSVKIENRNQFVTPLYRDKNKCSFVLMTILVLWNTLFYTVSGYYAKETCYAISWTKLDNIKDYGRKKTGRWEKKENEIYWPFPVEIKSNFFCLKYIFVIGPQ